MNTASTTNLQRISRASRLFIRLLQAFMVLVPLTDTAVWIFINDLPPSMKVHLLPHHVVLPLPLSGKVSAFCVSLIPLALFLLANNILIRLFRLYGGGMIFAADNVRCFRQLSRVLLGWCLAGILTDPLMSIALTWHHPAGRHMLSVGLTSADLTALFISGILVVITWVMDEARTLKDEQDFTI